MKFINKVASFTRKVITSNFLSVFLPSEEKL